MNRDNFKWDSAELKWILKKFLSQTVGPKSLEQTIDEFVASHSIGNEEWEIVEERKVCKDGYWTGQKEIIKVRRKSDGVVFTVGETVVHKTDGMINTAKILKFSPSKDNHKKMYFEFMEGENFVKDLANFQPLPQRTKPPLGPLSREVEKLEERIAYIEKKLNIEG